MKVKDTAHPSPSNIADSDGRPQISADGSSSSLSSLASDRTASSSFSASSTCSSHYDLTTYERSRQRKSIRFVQPPHTCGRRCSYDQVPNSMQMICKCFYRHQLRPVPERRELADHYERMRREGLHFLLPIDECAPLSLGQDSFQDRASICKEKSQESAVVDPLSSTRTRPQDAYLEACRKRHCRHQLTLRREAARMVQTLESDEYNDGFGSRELHHRVQSRCGLLRTIAMGTGAGRQANPVDMEYFFFDVETPKRIEEATRTVKTALKRRKPGRFTADLESRLRELQKELEMNRKAHFQTGSPEKSSEDLHALREEAEMLCKIVNG